MSNDYYVLYLLARTDLPSMGVGKASAHMAHAANKFTYDNIKFITDDSDNPIAAWHKEADGFGTTFSLHSKNEITLEVMERLFQELLKTKFNTLENAQIAGLVYDPTYPYVVDEEIVKLIDASKHTVEPIDIGGGKFLCHRGETTAMYVFGLKSELEPFMKDFGLMPNVHVSNL